MPPPAAARWRVHGLDLSYFTGKIEAYLRAKGIAYDLIEMDTADFRACARATGIAQMPQIELPDGRWLTDTSPTIGWIETQHPAPRITPAVPLLRFVSRLIEDFGDEALWRPALYYRWAMADDARLIGGRLAAGMLRDVPLPLAARRAMITWRQRRHYLRDEGVTRANRATIEALYLDTLAVLDAILATRHFILGARPCEGDFGLFASMFRHFFCDPTPARLMRDRAPHVLGWVTRLWALQPGDFAAAPPLDTLPADLAPLLALIAAGHLPYLAANAAAAANGAALVGYRVHGGEFTTATNTYHLWCLDALRADFAALDAADVAVLTPLLGAAGVAVLAAPRDSGVGPAPALPITAAPAGAPRGRHWQR